jgi:hypothetical protein
MRHPGRGCSNYQHDGRQLKGRLTLRVALPTYRALSNFIISSGTV